MIGRHVALAAWLLLWMAGAWPVEAAGRYDPRLRFRTISTPGFDIYFHQGEEHMARRMARIAEEVAERLSVELGRPSGRVRVILVNQTDVSNGWATPTPYNLIEITTVPPHGESSIGNTDDWLRLVFVHEYTHIVHLDASRGWIGGLRHVFGRLPVLYPNLFLPLWQIEGLATHHESALTDQGRVPAGDFRQLIDAAARAKRFDPLDRASGRLIDWPSGQAAYAYGGYFHHYLAGRFGQDSLVRLSRETAGRLPYFGAPAFRTVFGRSLGTLWKEFEADTTAALRDDGNRGTRLTHHGFSVSAPRFSADGRLFYSLLDPHGFPAILEWTPGGQAPRRVTTRYLGGRLSTIGDTLVFDALELVRNVALQSDLHAVAMDGGPPRNLTRHARAGDPDVSADGRTIVCTLQLTDRRALATLPYSSTPALGQPVVLVSEAATEFSSPRWSPDGRAIAVERRRLGGPSEIVVIDPASGSATTVASSARGRNVGPIWRPDGRAILFASDREGGAFRIYELETATATTRRLEGTGSGQSPALSPDGATLVFVGYTADGYDLFSLPMTSAAWTAAATATPTPSPTAPVEAPPAAAGAHDTPYRPWGTLGPRYWTPVADTDAGEIRAGAATSGVDALGRHGWVATLAWASRTRPDWQISYAYDRWWPTLYASVSEDTDPWRQGTARSQEFNVGLLLPVRRVRWAHATLAALHASDVAFGCTACVPSIDAETRRRSARLGWSVDTARSYGYSTSDEEGGTATVATEFTRRALGARGNGGAATLDLRGYRRLFGQHAVLAARAAAATSWGDAAARRQFSASGPGAQPPPFGFGVDAVGLLRGFDNQDVPGFHATVVNIDYRFPILGVQRGIGTLPFFLRTVHGAIFTDAGHAWSSRFARSQIRTSIGVELSLDTFIGYTLPLTFAGGLAWRHDPAAARHGAAVFGRVGRAF